MSRPSPALSLVSLASLCTVVCTAACSRTTGAAARSADSPSSAEPIVTVSVLTGPMDRRIDELFSRPLDAPAAPSVPSAKKRSLETTKENPFPTCGPRASYKWVASGFVCGDGSSPFQGDIEAARESRKGNVGKNATGHIIDLYIVPCPEGDREVYVDMYAGCEPGTSPL